MKLPRFFQRHRHDTTTHSEAVVSRKSRLGLALACVFAFGMAFSFGSAANDGGCNAECERYCFTQFMWCGGFFFDHCYPQYLECAQGCGCAIGG
jgi:hypothetical protein